MAEILPEPKAEDEKPVSLEEDFEPVSETEVELVAVISQSDDLMKGDVRGLREFAIERILELPEIKALIESDNVADDTALLIAALEARLRTEIVPELIVAGQKAERYGEVVGKMTSDI